MAHPFLPNSADATISDQAEPDSVDFDTLVAAHAVTGVVSGCVTSESASPGMKIDVTAGVVRYQGKPITVAGATDEAITAADGSNLRIDLVSINASGTVVVTDGTPAANAVAPAIPATSVPLAFVYVPQSDTSITDNQIVDKAIPVEDNHGLFNVAWYGAVGDASDETTEIQAAIDAAEVNGGTVLFPIGDYLVTSPLTVDDNVKLLGALESHYVAANVMARIRMATNDTGPVIRNADQTNGNVNIIIERLDIEGPTSGGGGSGPVISMKASGGSVKGFRLRNCFIRYGESYGVETGALVDSWIQDNYIQNSDGDAFHMVATSDLVFSGNYIATQSGGTGGDGVNLTGGGGFNKFLDNYVFICDTGFQINAGIGNVVANNIVRACYRDGISLSGASDAVIDNIVANNQAFDNGIGLVGNRAGIVANLNAHDNVVIGNRCYNKDETSQYNGIRIANTAYDNIIVGNNTVGNASAGLNVDSSGDNVIANNIDSNLPRVVEYNGDWTLHDGANAKRIEVLDGGDIVFYDEDGTTARLTWSESQTRWVLNSNLDFDDNSALFLASASFTDLAGTSDFLSIDQSVDLALFRMTDQSGSPVRTWLTVYGPNHATLAGDVVFASPGDAAVIWTWDESDDRLELSKNIDAQGNTIRDVNRAVEYASSPTLDWDDHIVSIDSAASTRAVTLPSCATYDGHSFFIQRDGANNVTIDSGTDTYSDTGTAADKTLGSDGAAIGIYSIGGTEWKVAGTEGTVT